MKKREVIRADVLGFCMGVRSAMKKVEQAASRKDKNDGVYTFGPLIHNAQVLEDLVAKGTIRFTKEVPMTVTWHDPCHIGRHCGIYEEPRNILRAIPGVRLVEMERIKDQAWCCGAGAGVRTA